VDRQDLFARPAAVFAGLLRQAGQPLDARGLKRRLADEGIEPDVADAAWRRAQPALRHHANIMFDEVHRTYRWAESPEQRVRAARERQLRIVAMRALADVLMEVEELAAAGADGAVTVERVRAMAQRQALTPIGRAGATIAFDPAWHRAIGAAPSPGVPVLVIRPGYLWQAGDEEILLGQAQVISTMEA
jgi:hypothetical protein